MGRIHEPGKLGRCSWPQVARFVAVVSDSGQSVAMLAHSELELGLVPCLLHMLASQLERGAARALTRLQEERDVVCRLITKVRV